MLEVRYIKFRSKRNFGIELEMNNKVPSKDLLKIVTEADPKHETLVSGTYVQDYNNKYWHIKFDRSCGEVKNEGGWEVASYKASGYKDIDNMAKVTDALKKGGAQVNNNCGFHIHVEIADFNRSAAATLVANWIKIEPLICQMLPRHRTNNEYCRLLSRILPIDFYKTYDPKEFWNVVCPKDVSHASRRVSLNMCNYAWVHGRKTVELRLPDCILDGKEVKNWLRFFISFVGSSKKSEFPKNLSAVNIAEMMKIVGLHGEDPFLLLSKGMRDTKMWVVNRILKHSSLKSSKTESQAILDKLVEEKKPTKKTEEMLVKWWEGEEVFR